MGKSAYTWSTNKKALIESNQRFKNMFSFVSID